MTTFSALFLKEFHLFDCMLSRNTVFQYTNGDVTKQNNQLLLRKTKNYLMFYLNNHVESNLVLFVMRYKFRVEDDLSYWFL